MQISTADQINTALLFVTALGVTAAIWQIRLGARAQRATFLKDLCMQLRTDPDVAHAFYEIEYNRFHYDQYFHHSELEKKVDRLLTLLDIVCEMRALNIISKREMTFFNYQIARVIANNGIQEYLKFLTEFYKTNGLNHRPFASLQKYCNI